MESDDGQMERRKKYKRFLWIWFWCSVAVFLGGAYYLCYSRIPSNIKIRAGMDQTLDFGVPVTGKFTKIREYPELVAVSENTEPVSPVQTVNMDLHESVTLRAVKKENYRLNLKLWGILPFKQIEVQVIEDELLTPAGIPIGIYVKTKGVLVIGVGDFKTLQGNSSAPARYLLKTGDYVLYVDGSAVEGKADFMNKIGSCEGHELVLTVQREDEIFDVKIQPQQNENGEYKLGIWIRDNAQGVGTLTFLDEGDRFGALGHGINDVDTNELLNLKSGTLYHTDIIDIRKGVSGAPGEMTGMIDYTGQNILGEIQENSVQGIYGEGNERLREQLEKEALPIALKQEIHKGQAQILCTIDDIPEYFEVEITDINLGHDNVNRGIVLKVTDPGLLEKTGGIIQGMSGAPILQDGRLIGAVTHVLVQDSAKGYGIFIENMLSES